MEKNKKIESKDKNSIIALILSSIALGLSIAILGVAIVMYNQVTKVVKTNSSNIRSLSSKITKLDAQVNGVPEYDVSMFEEIKAEDIESLSKGSKLVVFIGRSSCGYCAIFAPVLSDIQDEYNVDIKYIDIAKIINYESATGELLDEESDKILKEMSANDKGKTLMNDYGATPMLLIIENNKIINGQVGYSDFDYVAQLFDTEGFKKR